MAIDAAFTRRQGAFRLDVALRAEAPVVALFGRSGSGKTSVVNAIAGIASPDAGRIAIDGVTLYDSTRGIDLPPERRRIGYVFQDGLLFPHLSVAANLAYSERLTPGGERFVDRARVVSLLGLELLMERRPESLSGGEKQRVAIGRALLASPRILLMDEPLASLDAGRKAEILQYVELLRDELRLPIVYVSHALDEVTRLADRVVLLAEGRVIAQGSIAELMARRDLAPHTGRFEAGAVIESVVARHDEAYGLTVLAFDGGELVVPNVDALTGEPVRARIRARDVALALSRPVDSSFQNILPATVRSVGEEFGAIVDVSLSVGPTALLARVTRESAQRLGLVPGLAVYALVKAVAIDRRSVGYA
jgi:molybdate transport system ATP-binding protein